MRNPLRLVTGFVLGAIALSQLGGCLHRVRFNDIAAGTQFDAVGVAFTSNSETMTTEQFGTSPAAGGFVKIDPTNYAQGTGNALRCANMSVAFPTGHARWLKFKFADLGGTHVVTVNGVRQSAGRLHTLNGAVVAGQTITVTAAQSGNNWFGEFKVQGDITGFSIGGQELWIDDVTWREH